MLNSVFTHLLKSGTRVNPTKGPNREITGVLLKLKNPRARFSRTEQRGTLWSCLGETLWYFSGSDNLEHIEYYIPRYRHFSGLSERALQAPGAYGPRLFGVDNQVDKIINLLKEKRETRQAVIQIFDKKDLGQKDVPCTCSIQFLSRANCLHAFVYMRSNDAYRGLPHDVFAFTMLQEYIAVATGHKLGHYNHAVGSLHLYDEDNSKAQEYLSTGFQEELAMPAMPSGELPQSLKWLLHKEIEIREGNREDLDLGDCSAVRDYWLDLARLFLTKYVNDKMDVDGFQKLRLLSQIKQAMTSKVYDAFIRGREEKLQKTEQAQLSFIKELKV